MNEYMFNESYGDYGGRGISVCEEWQGTQGFFKNTVPKAWEAVKGFFKGIASKFKKHNALPPSLT